MFLLTGEAKYIDVLERTTFNGFLSGVSASGDRFFYPNPLEYDGEKKNNHEHAGRAPWFGCACCPPNLMRTLASLTGYFYAVKGNSLYVNFYAESTGEAEVAGTTVKLIQTTDYPWMGRTKLTVSPEKPATFSVHVRIPGWAQGKPLPSNLYAYEAAEAPAWTVRAGGRAVSGELKEGYVAITREWRRGDVIEVNFPMPVQIVRGHAGIKATRGQVAFERGPLVYCFEEVDQPIPATVAAGTKPEVELHSNMLGGMRVLSVEGSIAIPYYAWNNRGLHPMAVWRPVR
jgi:DUF1680 family protein